MEMITGYNMTLTQRLLVTRKYVLTLSFGYLCKFKVTVRKKLHPLFFNREKLDLLYF